MRFLAAILVAAALFSGCAHVLLSPEEGQRLNDSSWKIESEPGKAAPTAAPAPARAP